MTELDKLTRQGSHQTLLTGMNSNQSEMNYNTAKQDIDNQQILDKSQNTAAKKPQFVFPDPVQKGPVLQTSRRIINDLKESLTKPGTKMGRDSSTKKLYKSNKLFDQDKGKNKRFD